MTQAAAETAYDMVSPGTLSIEPKKIKRFPHHRLAHQPVDLREGVAKAYSVVKEVSEHLSGRARSSLPFACLPGFHLKSIPSLEFVPKKSLGVDLDLLPIASADACLR